MTLTEVTTDGVIHMERTNFFAEYSNSSKVDKNTLFRRSIKAKGNNARIALQTRCSWLQWFEITMFLSHICQSTPFYLKFDHVTQRYAVSTSTRRKMLWIFFNISSTTISLADLRVFVRDIRASHNVELYFNLFTLLAFFVFEIPFKYTMYCRMSKFHEFVERLQDSPLRIIASPASFRRSFWFGCFACWYLSMFFPFFVLRFGFYYWSFQSHYDALQMAGEVLFELPPAWLSEGSLRYETVALAFLLLSQQATIYLCGDILGVSAILTMYHIARDLDRAIQSQTLAEDEVEELIKAQKEITRTFNQAFGFTVSICVLYCTPYYALHIVEMFNTPGVINTITTLTFVIVLGVACKLAVDINVLANRRRRWLVKHGRLLKLGRSGVALFLRDINRNKFCVGSIFLLNAAALGKITSLMVTLTIVRLQTQG